MESQFNVYAKDFELVDGLLLTINDKSSEGWCKPPKQITLFDYKLNQYDNLIHKGEFKKLSENLFGFFNFEKHCQIFGVSDNKFQKVFQKKNQSWIYDIKQWQSKYIVLTSQNELKILNNSFENIKYKKIDQSMLLTKIYCNSKYILLQNYKQGLYLTSHRNLEILNYYPEFFNAYLNDNHTLFGWKYQQKQNQYNLSLMDLRSSKQVWKQSFGNSEQKTTVQKQKNNQNLFCFSSDKNVYLYELRKGRIAQYQLDSIPKKLRFYQLGKKILIKMKTLKTINISNYREEFNL